ncbi:EAL domain-containing response regulator [Xanthobacter sp. V3C-3]|uniref:EAL domain-containing response regulator n=1 Tax=Xanthobacter lutulentifluminis TaxID=3119935 RepID=UPI0037297073
MNPPNEPMGSPASARLRVFVLDDDTDFREDLSETRTLAGHDVFAAGDAAALTPARMCTMDVFILDLSMPGMDGTEVLRRMRRCRLAARVILVSGRPEDVIRAAADAARMGDLDVLGTFKKPVDPQDLLRLLSVELAAVLQSALDPGQVPVTFQPKIDVETLAFDGAEALLGDTGPAVGRVSPLQMVAAAARVPDLLTRLTCFMVRAAAEGCAVWTARGHAGAVSINVPLEAVLHPGSPAELAGLAREGGAEPGQIILELTEDALYDSSSDALMAIAQARLAGFGIALDDVGQRQSGLLQLARLPITELKIDRGLLTQARSSEKARSIFALLVELGHRLGLKVVAEGVEAPADLSFVKAEHVDLLQGFLVSRKLPLAELLALLEAWPQKQRALRGSAPQSGGEDGR